MTGVIWFALGIVAGNLIGWLITEVLRRQVYSKGYREGFDDAAREYQARYESVMRIAAFPDKINNPPPSASQWKPETAGLLDNVI